MELSQKLVTLKYELDIELDLKDAICDPSSFDVNTIAALFRELGFNRHNDELAKLVGSKPQPVEEPGEFQGGLFEAVQNIPRQTTSGDYKLIADVKSLKQLIEDAKKTGIFAVDTETDSLSTRSANLCGVSISLKEGTGYYIPTRSPNPKEHLNAETVLKHLRPLLEDESTTKIFHNLKFDLNVFRKHNVKVAGPLFLVIPARRLGILLVQARSK